MKSSCEMKTLSSMGALIGNVIRKIALTQLDSWRPVAFSIGTNSNVISAGSNVYEDTVEFSSSLTSIHFTVNEDSTAKVITLNTSCLQVADLETANVKVFTREEKDLSKEILHTINGNINLTIFLRNGKGSYTAKENEKFLRESPETSAQITNAVVYLNSRHCDILDPGFDVSKLEDEEIIRFNIESLIDKTADSIVSECCGILYDSFASNYN